MTHRDACESVDLDKRIFTHDVCVSEKKKGVLMRG
jgi:hypothetical protein